LPAEGSNPRTERPALGGLVAAFVASGLLLADVLVGSAWLRKVGSTPRVMLDVLPFENLSGHPRHQVLSDGLTEGTTTALARLRPDRLGVTARTSANVYKKSPKAVGEIGRELGVEHLVEGSVRRQADRLRVTAQLVRVRDQTHLWAESYDRAAADTLALQDDVAHRVVAALVGRLLADPAPAPPASSPQPK